MRGEERRKGILKKKGILYIVEVKKGKLEVSEI